MEEAILFKENQGKIFIKPTGHMTAALCSDLRERCFSIIDSGAPISSFQMDMSDCEYMDSTFMGLIVGFAKRLKPRQLKITLFRTNKTCQDLLKTIGVLKLVDLSDEKVEVPPFAEKISGEESVTAEFILDAHENLMELSDENRSRFSTLKTVLSSQIEGDRKNRDGGSGK